jgi:hypothetical protein
MADTFYVDFDLSTSGNIGTSGDPFNWDDMVYCLENSISADSNFYCKGSQVGGGVAVDNAGGELVKLLGWGDEVWRLSGTNWSFNIVDAIYFDNAILYDVGMNAIGNISNCFIFNGLFIILYDNSKNTFVLTKTLSDISEYDYGCLNACVYVENSETLIDNTHGGNSAVDCITNSLTFSGAFSDHSDGGGNILNADMGYIPHFTETNLEKFNLGWGEYGVGLTWAEPFSGYYIDFSESTSGHAGTIFDPFNYDDFIDSLSGTNRTYKAKGSYESPSNVSILITSAVSISAWDVYNYGPWRLKSTYAVIDISNSASDINDCILAGDYTGYIAIPNCNNVYIIDAWSVELNGNEMTNVVFGPEYMFIFGSISNTNFIFNNCLFALSGRPTDGYGQLVPNNGSIVNNSATFNDCYTTEDELSGLCRTADVTTIVDNGINYSVSANNTPNPPNWEDINLANFNAIAENQIVSWATNRTFYFNINNVYSATDGSGLTTDPWSIEQFQEFMRYTYGANGVSGQTFVRDYDTLKVKGSYEAPSDVIFLPYWLNDEYRSSAVTIEAWEPTINGHWKVRPINALDVSDFSIYDINQGRPVSLIIKDGVIQNLYVKTHAGPISLNDYATTLPPYGLVDYQFKNCILSGDTWFDNTINSATSANNYDMFNGCTFVDGTFYLKDQIYTTCAGYTGIIEDSTVFEKLEFNDCVALNTLFDLTDISTSGLYMPPKDLITFNYCEFSGTSAQSIEYSAAYDDVTLSACNFEITPSVTFPLYDDITVNNQDSLDYRLYGLTKTKETREDTWIADDYNEGYMDSSRKAAGSFSFAHISYLGHIGAFYFGPVSETINVGTLEISAVLLQPTISTVNAISATVVPTQLTVRYTLLQPTIYATQDLEIDFVGVPVSGPVPLIVEFTAYINFSAELKNKYKVKEYRWCFNYDYDNNTCLEDWVITTANPTTHIYKGHAGQKFSVKACVTLELL